MHCAPKSPHDSCGDCRVGLGYLCRRLPAKGMASPGTRLPCGSPARASSPGCPNLGTPTSWALCPIPSGAELLAGQEPSSLGLRPWASRPLEPMSPRVPSAVSGPKSSLTISRTPGASCSDGTNRPCSYPPRLWCSPRPPIVLVPSLQQLLLHPRPGSGGWWVWAPSTSCACTGSFLLPSTCLTLTAPNPSSGSSTSGFPCCSPGCHHRVQPNLGTS